MRNLCRQWLGTIGVLCAVGALVRGQSVANYDLVIRNGFVLDGAGNPWVLADAAVRPAQQR